MGVELGVIDWLIADTTITADVHAIARPQGDTSSAICVQRISGGMLYADDGEVGLTQCRVQLDIYASSYATAKGLAKTVLTRMNALVDQLSGGVTFRYVGLDAEQDARESEISYEFRMTQDYIITTE